jgi:heterodisulfide reductase subunit C
MKLVATLTPKKSRRNFVKEVMKMDGGEHILDCIQCGLCAGSCPTRFAMDYSPMQILKMVHLGMREQVLSSSTIWICSTCHTCATRCPRAVNITNLMMSLRNVAIEENFVNKKETKAKFHKSFFEVVNKYGRLHEPSLLLKIIKKTDAPGLLHNASLGWRFLRRGRLKLRPEKIKHVAELDKMLEKTNGGKAK